MVKEKDSCKSIKSCKQQTNKNNSIKINTLIPNRYFIHATIKYCNVTMSPGEIRFCLSSGAQNLKRKNGV